MSGESKKVMEETARSLSPEETAKFAAALARRTPLGSVVALHGELGAGKTVFARGFARGLGISEPVTSPSFAIVQEYVFGRDGRKCRLYHIDLYRLNSQGEASAFGLDEILCDPDGIALVEWAERLGDGIPRGCLHVRISGGEGFGEDERRLAVSGAP